MNKIGKEKRLFLVVGLLIGIIAVFVNEIGFFKRLELITFDLRLLVNKEKRYRGDEVVLVAIRPKDIKELGKFPWPRSIYAQVIDNVREGGAKVICFDVFFTSTRTPREDQALAEVTGKAGNVLYPVFYDQKLTAEMFQDGIAFVPGLTRNIQMFAKAAAGEGHINLREDIDEKIRRVPSFLSFEGEVFPASGLLSVLEYHDIPLKEVRREEDYIRAGDYKIPLDEEGNILIKNFGVLGENIPWYSFADVKSRRVQGKAFKGKIVIVGYAVPGAVETDVHITPLGRRHGITIIASLINTILRRDFVEYLSLATNSLILLLLSVFCILIMTGGNFRRNTLLTTGLIIAEGGLSIYLFEKPGIVLETIPLLIVILSNYVLGTFVVSRKTDIAIREGEARLKMFQEMAKTSTSLSGKKVSLDFIVSCIAQALKVELCILREFDKESGILKLVATYGLEKDIRNRDIFEFDLKVAERAIASSGPLVISGKENSTGDERASVMCSALRIRGEIIGTISVHGKVVPTPPGSFFTKEDENFFTALCYEVTVAVKNAQLYREVKKLFLDAVASLVAAIDAKDPYTEHHSERVALYSAAIAEELGLSKEDKETLQLIATLHDIGKIAVPGSILSKPGKLTAEEYNEVKLHPVKGTQIVKHISQLQPIIPAILHHHERHDGRGYPDGLAGEGIPLMARIIAVADAYDAMTSSRPYRRACTARHACREIKQNIGTQFNAQVAEAFLRAFSNGNIRKSAPKF